MAKTVSAKEYRKKNTADLLAELKKLREELQKIRFTKGSGTAVSKLSKIKDLRKQIARILTIIRQNRKEEVVKGLRERVTKKEEGKEGKEEEGKTTINRRISGGRQDDHAVGNGPCLGQTELQSFRQENRKLCPNIYSALLGISSCITRGNENFC